MTPSSWNKGQKVRFLEKCRQLTSNLTPFSSSRGLSHAKVLLLLYWCCPPLFVSGCCLCSLCCTSTFSTLSSCAFECTRYSSLLEQKCGAMNVRQRLAFEFLQSSIICYQLIFIIISHPSMQAELNAKVVVIGPVGVGKSSLTIRYVHNEFHESLDSTLGAVYYEKIQVVKGRRVKFQFWDTAGQEKYKSIARIYYKDCKIALVVYDVTNRDSFEGLKTWVNELKTNGPQHLWPLSEIKQTCRPTMSSPMSRSRSTPTNWAQFFTTQALRTERALDSCSKCWQSVLYCCIHRRVNVRRSWERRKGRRTLSAAEIGHLYYEVSVLRLQYMEKADRGQKDQLLAMYCYRKLMRCMQMPFSSIHFSLKLSHSISALLHLPSNYPQFLSTKLILSFNFYNLSAFLSFNSDNSTYISANFPDRKVTSSSLVWIKAVNAAFFLVARSSFVLRSFVSPSSRLMVERRLMMVSSFLHDPESRSRFIALSSLRNSQFSSRRIWFSFSMPFSGLWKLPLRAAQARGLVPSSCLLALF